ncbi:alpha/beta hydrolase [Paeniglutamicibacter gangotriensis]|uniref:Putative membrane protein n=1 Tax=Paeniglutamicibacter gangotriensis Lz1y TaxID=1276920 RepID=M7NF37_9MICC|nr:alpha/beta-hydrolase family protein [Paeniglutamicibacter gangotriensis]EMQ97128.1 putative membrane protein [Paeniglutamicibacter gangotriensis Lz1y]
MRSEPPAISGIPLTGVVCGLLLASLALTPSLVPRPTVFQGFLSGLWFMIGYGLGTPVHRVGSWLLGRIRTRRWFPASRPLHSASRTGLLVLATMLLVLYVVIYSGLVVSWQNEVRALVEMGPVDGAGHLRFLIAMVVTMSLCYWIFRGIGALRVMAARWARRRGSGPGRARAMGLLAGLLASFVLVAGLVGAGLGAVGSIYAARDAQTLEGSRRPELPLRSGSPDSILAWDRLGRQGRAFVGGGPSAAAIARVGASDATEPIRVYAGLGQGVDLAERAELVVGELERTGAFEREVLLVATPTGSGWLEPQAIAALEYLYAGDTATASMQYSFQPSWVSFLFAPELSTQSSSALFDAVHARWKQLPASDRPKLAVYGLSLGAQGMQGHFADLGDLLDRTDAALFTGPPSNSQPWRTLQAARDPDTPIWQPTYRGGASVRWQSKPGDFANLAGTWNQPRVGYLQHATDPITWLDASVIYQRPEWLAGPAVEGGRGSDVSDAMRWIPGVTFLHLVTDMLVSEAVPPSHGHNFGDVALDGWAQVLPGHGRSDAQLASIQAVLETIDTHDPIWE